MATKPTVEPGRTFRTTSGSILRVTDDRVYTEEDWPQRIGPQALRLQRCKYVDPASRGHDCIVAPEYLLECCEEVTT